MNTTQAGGHQVTIGTSAYWNGTRKVFTVTCSCGWDGCGVRSRKGADALAAWHLGEVK